MFWAYLLQSVQGAPRRPIQEHSGRERAGWASTGGRRRRLTENLGPVPPRWRGSQSLGPALARVPEPGSRVGAGPRAWVKAPPGTPEPTSPRSGRPGARVKESERTADPVQNAQKPPQPARFRYISAPQALMQRLRSRAGCFWAKCTGCGATRIGFEPQPDPAGRNSSRSATQPATIRAAARPSRPQFESQRNSAGHDASRSPTSSHETHVKGANVPSSRPASAT